MGDTMPTAIPNPLQLLLARAGMRDPVLQRGLSDDALLEVQVDTKRTTEVAFFEPGGDPNDLAAQGWGVVVPVGESGERLMALAKPLIDARGEQQGKPVKVYKVAPGKGATPQEAAEWKAENVDNGQGRAQDVPLYYLILGDPKQVPFALQQVLAIDNYVGRLHFDEEAGFEAYVAKLLAAERVGPAGPGRVVVHTAHDGSDAVTIGFEALVKPCVTTIEQAAREGLCTTPEVYGKLFDVGRGALLNRAAVRTPGVLFTMSHGLGDDFADAADKRARQGAMSFGSEGELIGDDVAGVPFMPNGLWVMFACYGAGTPDTSAYATWLRRLSSFGRLAGYPQYVVDNLAGKGDPFIARLPQRALANPDGPLAFFGHADLAWTYSFQEENDPAKGRPGRFERILETALRGHRVGIAAGALARFVSSTDTRLALAYGQDAGAEVPRQEQVRRAYLWMSRNDLSGFVLLGDPAARLQVKPNLSPKLPVIPTGAKETLEEIICHAILGDAGMKELAARVGLTREELERVYLAYRDAGRKAAGLGP
jgi:hypothetical protein